MTHTPSKNMDFREVFELPDCFPKEFVRTKTYLFEKEPKVQRLRGVEAMRVMKPHHSVTQSISKKW